MPQNETRPSAAMAEQKWEQSTPPSRLVRRRRKRYDETIVNLTSMVDVLSVLMFFLLSIYSGGGYLTILPSGLELPSSNVRTPLSRQVEIAVLKDGILVDRQPVADNLSDGNTELLLPGLQAALAAHGSNGAPDVRVTIEADRSIPFRLLKKVIYTADQAGFRKQSLAVHQVSG